MFALARVTKRYGAEIAVDRVDLDLEPATTTALVGTSGSGKSTLLRLMLTLIRPDEGEVRFGGRALATRDDVHHQAVTEARLATGYVIQDGGLFPHMSARDNVVLGARRNKWKAPRIADRLDELIALARFPTDALDRYPGELSGGQRQRVALMRALMLDPDVLLLDEPLGALDPITRFELQDELRKIFDTLGKTVALVTHDLEEAAYFAQTIVLLEAGRIVQRGTLDTLKNDPADDFVERFVRAGHGRPEALLR